MLKLLSVAMENTDQH